MWSFIRKMIRFRIGQKVSRGAARRLGLRPISSLLGVIGGLKAVRKH
ncbi:MAG TPA: hypothetical protein VMS56_11860 [Thermoanaerobaculia bacterium]|nr:hypothetical protein [Thermoanaerobaculia bacterium]